MGTVVVLAFIVAGFVWGAYAIEHPEAQIHLPALTPQQKLALCLLAVVANLWAAYRSARKREWGKIAAHSVACAAMLYTQFH
jgi:hypothetical protein